MTSAFAQTPLKSYVFQRTAVRPVPDSRPKFGATANGCGTGRTFWLGLQSVEEPRAALALKSLALGPGVVLRKGALACQFAHSAGETGNHQNPSVRFVSLLKPKGDPVRTASALRQGISCTIGDKSG